MYIYIFVQITKASDVSFSQSIHKRAPLTKTGLLMSTQQQQLTAQKKKLKLATKNEIEAVQHGDKMSASNILGAVEFA